MPVTYQLGFSDEHIPAAARLYDAAFGKKFAVAIPCAAARRRFVESAMNPKCAFAAFADNGELAGIVGFHFAGRQFIGGETTFADLAAPLGFVGAARAAAVFALYERKPKPGELLMDGIAVAAKMRGRGIGGGLLDAIIQHGKSNNFARVTLDVIDINPDAKRLYLRKGFAEVRTENFAFLRPLLDFGAATKMCKSLKE